MAHDMTEQTPFGAPPPDPELERLTPLVGTWRAEDHTEDSVLGHGVPVASTESFHWLDGGYFLVSTYETVFGDQPAQKGINYWSYDSQAQRFRVIFFSNNGPFSEDGNRYRGEAAGRTLTFEGPARFQFKLDENGRIELDGDGRHSVAWWLRDQNGKWRPWMNNTFTPIDG